jgi:hypothetical protein
VGSRDRNPADRPERDPGAVDVDHDVGGSGTERRDELVVLVEQVGAVRQRGRLWGEVVDGVQKGRS